MEWLSERQLQLLRLLPPYNRVRWRSGRIERKLTVGGKTFMPSTFNSLVDRGLVWGVDHSYGRIGAGRLAAADAYLA